MEMGVKFQFRFLGRRIADLREAHGWTQAELGRRVGVSQGTVGGWEIGAAMSLSNLYAVAAVLGTQAHVLLRPERAEESRTAA